MRFLGKGGVVVLGVLLLGACGDSAGEIPSESFQKLEALVREMESQGAQMAEKLDTVAGYYEFLLSKQDSIRALNRPSPYTIDGAFSTNLPGQDSMLSSVIILNSTPDRRKAEDEVLLTNSLDSVFAAFIRENRNAAQIYSNSPMQVSRVYPTYDVKNIVDPEIDVTKFNFYYQADYSRNPSKGLVWINEPYVDPAGKGWILSLVHPVYDGHELFAVLGVDYTVTDLIQRYLDSQEGQLLLVNSKGDIVTGKADAIQALDMPPLKNHVYRETVQSDYFRVSDFNLFNSKSREVRDMAQRFFLEKKDRYEFSDDTKVRWAICQPFQSIDWYLIEISPKY